MPLQKEIQTNIVSCSFVVTTEAWSQERLSVEPGYKNGIPPTCVQETLTHQAVRVKPKERKGKAK